MGVFGCQATCDKFVADYALQLLEKSVLAANVQIPKSEKSGAWACRAKILNSHIELTRSGDKQNGGTYTSVDLVNIRLTLPNSSVVHTPFLKFAEKYSSIVSVAGAESTPAALPKRRPAPKARPVKEVMKKVMKKARK